jgi:uncharacterized protein YjbI with pentapeptide repeats
MSDFADASSSKGGLVRMAAVGAAAIVAGVLFGSGTLKRATPEFIAPAAAQNGPTCASTTGKGRNFAGQDLTNHNFSADPPGYLVGANFKGAKLSGAIFARQDLTNASFEGANLGPSKAPVNFTSAILANTCFINADLDETDFAFAVVTCADFSGTSLIKATFGPTQNFVSAMTCRTKFVGATLDVNLITSDFSGKSNWSKSDFTRANFQNVSPATFNLRGKDITGAILKETSFIGIDMTAANLTDVDFTQATLTKAKLDNAALNGAVLYNAQAESATFVCAQAYGNSGGQPRPDHTPCPAAPKSTDPLKAADFTFAGLKATDFTAATMDHAILAGANLNGATFTNASLVQANLQSIGGSGPANVQFAIFINVKFTNAQLASVNFSGSKLVGAVFDATTLNKTNFSNATMSDASFIGAKIQSVYFSAANLQSAQFNNVKIQAPDKEGEFGADFSCGQLGGTVFADSDISAANFGNAVMPAESDCCPAKSPGGKPWCGIVDATQQTYDPVTFPLLKQPVTCPDGSTGRCTGSQWRLSSNWQTRDCNVDRVLKTMWSKPNCDGSPGEIVAFKDHNLKECILATLPGQTEVLLATAQQIVQVNCPGRGIYDLTGLENFIALTKLDLSNNQLTIFTLSFVSGGKSAPSNLQTLDVSNNQLTTLDLVGHPKLVSLSAANNQLGSISLHANTFLVVLGAAHNKLESFDLPIQTSLAYVDLSYNKLTNVLNQFSTNLNALDGLTYLDLSHNGLTTIGAITKLAWNKRTGAGGRLQSLFLACNADFRCGDLNVYDGSLYPAASTSLCSSYNTSTGEWTPLSTPQCPPG